MVDVGVTTADATRGQPTASLRPSRYPKGRTLCSTRTRLYGRCGHLCMSKFCNTGCNTRPSFGHPGTRKAESSARHVQDGMLSIKSKVRQQWMQHATILRTTWCPKGRELCSPRARQDGGCPQQEVRLQRVRHATILRTIRYQ